MDPQSEYTPPQEVTQNTAPIVEASPENENPLQKEAHLMAMNALEHGNLDIAREVLNQAGISSPEINKFIGENIAKVEKNNPVYALQAALRSINSLAPELERGNNPRALYELGNQISRLAEIQLKREQERSSDFADLRRFIQKST